MKMFRCMAIISVVAMVVTFSIDDAMAEKFTCKSNGGLSPYSVQGTPGYDHERYAPSQREKIKGFRAYVSSFDGHDDDDGDGDADLLAVPQWVSYELRGLDPQADGSFKEPDISINPPRPWYKAPGLRFLWTNRQGVRKSGLDDSYRGIGEVWNRGHLAMADHAQRISWQASCNTYFFWNAVPQASDMNQGPWRCFENYTAAAANRFKRLWIVAGPIFEKNRPVGFIGEALKGEVPVAVPHGMFKVVVREVGDGKVAVLALLFTQRYEEGADGEPRPVENWENYSEAKCRQHVYDHRSRLRSIDEIEALTGLTFFSDVVNREQVRTRVPTELWPLSLIHI